MITRLKISIYSREQNWTIRTKLDKSDKKSDILTKLDNLDKIAKFGQNQTKSQTF